MKEDLIIAIDGFSSTGKSSMSKIIAKNLNYIHIDSENFQIESVELVDLVGKVIRANTSVNSNSLVWDIQQLSSGVYMLKTTVNGIVQTHKFVKK